MSYEFKGIKFVDCVFSPTDLQRISPQLRELAFLADYWDHDIKPHALPIKSADEKAVIVHELPPDTRDGYASGEEVMDFLIKLKGDMSRYEILLEADPKNKSLSRLVGKLRQTYSRYEEAYQKFATLRCKK